MEVTPPADPMHFIFEYKITPGTRQFSNTRLPSPSSSATSPPGAANRTTRWIGRREWCSPIRHDRFRLCLGN